MRHYKKFEELTQTVGFIEVEGKYFQEIKDGEMDGEATNEKIILYRKGKLWNRIKAFFGVIDE